MRLKEAINIHRLEGLPEVEVWNVRNTSKLYKIFHETYTICSVRVAGGEWRYRGRDHVTNSPSLMLLEPGNLHITKFVVRPISYDVLLLPPHLLESIARDVGIKKPIHFRFSNISTPHGNPFINKFHRAYHSGASSLELNTILMKCVISLGDYLEVKPNLRDHLINEKAMSIARDYLHMHSRQNISLETLSEITGLSKFHLLRSFSRKFGLPPHSYQNQIRISKVREELAQGIPPAEIDAGFSDQSHLTKHFRRAVGVLPSQYAQMIRKPSTGWCRVSA